MNDAGSGAVDKSYDNKKSGRFTPLFGSPALIQQQKTNPVFEPFPKNSSTLLVAPSKTGKSWFLKVILENQELYFRDLIFGPDTSG